IVLGQHVAPRIEAGVQEIAAEGRLVGPLVGEEQASRWTPQTVAAVGELAAYRIGEDDRLPPALLGDEAERRELDVLEEETARAQQAADRGAEPAGAGKDGGIERLPEGGRNCGDASFGRGCDLKSGIRFQPAADGGGGVRPG